MQLINPLLVAILAAFACVADAKAPANAAATNFEGKWLHNNATPLVRAPEVSTLVITAEQAAALDAARNKKSEDRSKPTEPTEFYDNRTIEPIRGEFHSSIIIDPIDGALPGTPLFHERMAKVGAAVMNGMDGPEQRPTSERCLGSLGSAPMLATPASNVHQFIQADNFILFISEENHDARMIRMHANHRPATVTSWDGDSIGWWEGNTLVVETKYFTPSDTARMNGQSVFLVSPLTTVLERFAKLSHDELSYVFTVEDASLYTRPWTGESLLLRTDVPLLEYACHEGNYSLSNVLRGARVGEASKQPAG